jgi:hypothetical protein
VSPREHSGIFFFALCVAYLFFLVWRMSLLRQPGIPFWQIVVAGPFLFLTPERYFRDGHHGAPWRFMLWWAIGATAIFLLAAQIQKWIGVAAAA